jgi:hypothetical protein
MIEDHLDYPPEQRKLYRDGFLYAKWKRKYRHTALFQEMLEDEGSQKQFPVRHPPLKSQTYGFGELFLGIHYIELGYDAYRYHYAKKWNPPGYRKAVEILGQKAADYICRDFPQPPDLFVFDRKGRFFLAEAKLPGDRLNENQKRFFRQIQTYLNQKMPRYKRALCMPEGLWIKIIRLKPGITSTSERVAKH